MGWLWCNCGLIVCCSYGDLLRYDNPNQTISAHTEHWEQLKKLFRYLLGSCSLSNISFTFKIFCIWPLNVILKYDLVIKDTHTYWEYIAIEEDQYHYPVKLLAILSTTKWLLYHSHSVEFVFSRSNLKKRRSHCSFHSTSFPLSDHWESKKSLYTHKTCVRLST